MIYSHVCLLVHPALWEQTRSLPPHTYNNVWHIVGPQSVVKVTVRARICTIYIIKTTSYSVVVFSTSKPKPSDSSDP